MGKRDFKSFKCERNIRFHWWHSHASHEQWYRTYLLETRWRSGKQLDNQLNQWWTCTKLPFCWVGISYLDRAPGPFFSIKSHKKLSIEICYCNSQTGRHVSHCFPIPKLKLSGQSYHPSNHLRLAFVEPAKVCWIEIIESGRWSFYKDSTINSQSLAPIFSSWSLCHQLISFLALSNKKNHNNIWITQMSLLSILLHYNTRLILATFVGHQQTTNVLGPTAIIVASMVILKQLATKFMGTLQAHSPLVDRTLMLLSRVLLSLMSTLQLLLLLHLTISLPISRRNNINRSLLLSIVLLLKSTLMILLVSI